MNRSRERNSTRPARNDLIGFEVESVGGPTGNIDPATRNASGRYLVVKTGRWPFRRRVVVPTGSVNCVDVQRRRLWVERDRDAVRNAPEFDQARHGAMDPSPAGSARTR